MLRYIDDEGLPYRVTLVYSNRTRAETAFLDELRDLERRRPDFRLVLTMTQDPTWTGETRRIDAGFLRERLGALLDHATVMVAGPPGMVSAVEEALAGAGVEKERVLADRYSGY
jgi:ferredoxin-NADP reductase